MPSIRPTPPTSSHPHLDNGVYLGPTSPTSLSNSTGHLATSTPTLRRLRSEQLLTDELNSEYLPTSPTTVPSTILELQSTPFSNSDQVHRSERQARGATSSPLLPLEARNQLRHTQDLWTRFLDGYRWEEDIRRWTRPILQLQPDQGTTLKGSRELQELSESMRSSNIAISTRIVELSLREHKDASHKTGLLNGGEMVIIFSVPPRGSLEEVYGVVRYTFQRLLPLEDTITCLQTLRFFWKLGTAVSCMLCGLGKNHTSVVERSVDYAVVNKMEMRPAVVIEMCSIGRSEPPSLIRTTILSRCLDVGNRLTFVDLMDLFHRFQARVEGISTTPEGSHRAPEAIYYACNIAALASFIVPPKVEDRPASRLPNMKE